MRILALILVLLISFQSIIVYSESLNTKNLTPNSMQNTYEKKGISNIKSKIENIEYREREPGEYRMGYDNTLAWWNPDWHFRIRIEVTSQDFERHDFPVELTINFSAYLAPLSVSEPIDLNSIRIIEYVTDVEDGISLPIGYKNSHAILINSTYSVVKIKFIMNDTTKKNESRLFYVYFDTIKFPKPEVVIENKRFIHGNTKTLVYGVGTLNDWLGSEEDFGNGSLGLNGWLQIALAQGIISSYQWANPPSYFGFVSYNQAVVENLSSSDYGIFIYDISQNSDSINNSYFYILTEKARESICKFIAEGGKVIIGAHPNAQSEDVLDNNPSLKKYFPFKTQAWNDTRYHGFLTEKSPRIPYYISEYELTNFVSYGMRHRGFGAKLELVDGAGEIWATDEYGNNVTASLGYNVFNCELFGCQVEHPDANTYAYFLLNMLANQNISSPPLINIGDIEYVNGVFLRINSSGNFLNSIELETDPLDEININLTTFYRGALPATVLLECISNEKGCNLSFTSETFIFTGEGKEDRTLSITLPEDAKDGEFFYINFSARILGDFNESRISMVIKSKYEMSCRLSVLGNLDYFPGEKAIFYGVLKNTGRHPSIFYFDVSGYWNVSTDADWAYIEPNNSSAFIINADIPYDAPFGATSEVEIKAFADPRTDVNDTLKCILRVKKVSALFLDCINESIEIKPGECAKFKFVVRNEGNSHEIIHLSSNVHDGNHNLSTDWLLTLETSEIMLKPKGSVMLNATLCAPLNALFGDFCIIYIEAVAENVSESDSLLAFVSELPGLELFSIPTMQTAKPNESVEFYIHVKNTGNNQAKFDLNANNNAYFANGKNSTQTGIIFPKETEIVKLIFKVPENAISGMQYDIYISGSGKNITRSLKVIVNVEHEHNTTYSVNTPIILIPGEKSNQSISLSNFGNANESVVIIVESTPWLGVWLGATFNDSFEYNAKVYAFSNLTINATFYASKYVKHGIYEINFTFIDHQFSTTLNVPVYIAQIFDVEIEFKNDYQKITDGTATFFEVIVKNIGNGLDNISLSAISQNASFLFEKDKLKLEANDQAIVKLFVKPKSRCRDLTIECISTSLGDSDSDFAYIQIQPRMQKLEENLCCFSLVILILLLVIFLFLKYKQRRYRKGVSIRIQMKIRA